ncbi:MAG: biosynthetic arginine decarboxylase [Spirochaetia bacterium]
MDPSKWTADMAAATYGLREWGTGYFDVSDSGEVTVKPDNSSESPATSLLEIVRGAEARGLDMPFLLRVENILQHRIERINESFSAAMQESGYRGGYQGVFPIKTNQQAQIVEEITSVGKRFSCGLEAGSKAELLIALAMVELPESLIICNGYKDPEFIDLGLRATKMGYNVVFVVEMPPEVETILERSNALEIQPTIGLRMKLSTGSSGHWQDSGGDSSIFGLTTSQVVDVVDRLRTAERLECLRLLHFHLGSQIPNIGAIRTAVREAARFYVQIVREGAPLGYLDIGGGLAVDYEGSQSSSDYSKNYHLDEYTADVVDVLVSVLNENEVEHPLVVTENGRATIAYSSILVFNVLNTTPYEAGSFPREQPSDLPEAVRDMYEVYHSLDIRNLQETYNDAVYYRRELRNQFEQGMLSIRERALGENIYIEVIRTVARRVRETERVPRELIELPDSLYDIYYGNFSVFQSLPDVWAIQQVFPVMPLHRMNSPPDRRAIVADITCDSDGKISRFYGPGGLLPSIPVHSIRAGEEYYLGIFLVGAYQETLGDLHNLFGDTNVASVRLTSDGGFEFVREIRADTVADVLRFVEYRPASLVERVRSNAEKALHKGRITVAERRMFLESYDAALRGYTYYNYRK